MDKNKLYVGNLPYTTTAQDLETMFAEAGSVVEAVVIDDRRTGRSKGFGFVTMADEPAAQTAVEKFNGSTIGDRQITVNVARPKREDNAPRTGYLR